MKQYPIVLFLLLCLPALATVPPNEYICNGENVTVSFSRSSFTGQPIFQITRPEALRPERYQKQLFTQDSPIGELVWLKLDPAADGPNGTVTLVVPKIILDPSEKGPIPFTTQLISVTELSFWGGVENLTGLLETRKIEQLNCTARWVAF